MTKILNNGELIQFEPGNNSFFVWDFENSNFDIVSNFVFRVSNLLFTRFSPLPF
jgi:hypothetical protein